MPKKYNLGIIFVVTLPLIGVFLWAIAPSATFKFDSLLGIVTVFGQLFGVLGFILFGTSLILSARFHFLENLFYGLNKVYERHSQIGKTAFYLLLFHPLLLFATYTNFSFVGIIDFFTPSENWALNFGIFSLGLMTLLIILTLYLRPKYNIWKWTHKFMGLAFFFGAVHAFLMSGGVASFMPFRIYMLSIFVFSIFSFIYHTVLGKFLIKKYQYVVSRVQMLGENIIEVSLSPAGEKLNFIPGQFAFVSFFDKNVKKESHPFSLSSSAGRDTISFTMKNLGDYTNTLPELQVGAKALIEGPFGKFSYKDARYKNQIWIAGGIGVTPFLSMIESVSKEADYSVDFYYCVKDATEAVHLNELKSFENSNIRIIAHYSSTDGFVNADVIKQKSGGPDGLREKDIFICSPPVMIESLRKQFLASGVHPELIHSEEFRLRD